MGKTFEIIPSWAGVLPLLVEAAQSNSFQARRDAMIELKRMAELADRYVSFVKIAEHKRTQKEQANGQ